jgi:hypothetical protein
MGFVRRQTAHGIRMQLRDGGAQTRIRDGRGTMFRELSSASGGFLGDLPAESGIANSPAPIAVGNLAMGASESGGFWSNRLANTSVLDQVFASSDALGE